MGNVESGPEMRCPQTLNERVSKHTTTSVVYSGGQGKTVTAYTITSPVQQQQDDRQPNVSERLGLNASMAVRTGSEMAHGSPRNNNNQRSLLSTPQAQSSHVKFHSVPVERMRSAMASPRDRSAAYPSVQDHQMMHDVQIKNSILESENEEYDDTEVGRLYKRITSLGQDVIEATAAVYHYLETHNIDDEMTVSGRSQTVLNLIKKAAEKGNTQPAYKFLETAKAVTEILEEEGSTNDGNEQNSVPNQSADIIHMLEETASLNGGGSIFRVLDEDEIIVKDKATTRSLGNTANLECDVDCFPSALRACSPRSQKTQKARGAPIYSELNSTAPEYDADKYVPEAKSTAEETEVQSHYGQGVYTYREANDDDYPAVRAIDTNGEAQFDLTDLPHLHNVDEDMDLEFVEHFDMAFNEFVARNPDFVAHNPELVHNLRILKLQMFLEYNETLERSLKGKKERLEHEKKEAEEIMQSQLRDAARKKAARQTFLQSELNNLSWSTKRVQAQLRWKFLEYSEDRAKRQFKMRHQFRAIPQAHTREHLIALIPDGPEGRQLRDAVQAAVEADRSKPYMLSTKQLEQLREYQAENSVMSSEMSMLKKKLEELRVESRKYAWVESVLVRMDEGTMYKLKNKYQKKEGVSSAA